MGLNMHLLESVCSERSLCARGTGFYYHFDKTDHTLQIYCEISEQLIYEAMCSKFVSLNPQAFIEKLEKLAQIKALVLSNNQTINLNDILACDRLHGILENNTSIANKSNYLQNHHFKKFTCFLKEKHGLEEFQIKSLCCAKSGTSYFRALLKTFKGNEITVRDITLSGLTRKISEAITYDLIAREFSFSIGGPADNLLILSTKLKLLSRLLDPYFYPEKMLLLYTQSEENQGLS